MSIDPAVLPDRLGPDDPRGPLTFASPLPAEIQNAEDSTAAADHDRVHALGVRFQRPATLTERRLLEALGWTDAEGNPPGPETMTSVRWLSHGVRRREWPTLYPPIEPTTTTEGEAL